MQCMYILVVTVSLTLCVGLPSQKVFFFQRCIFMSLSLMLLLAVFTFPPSFPNPFAARAALMSPSFHQRSLLFDFLIKTPSASAVSDRKHFGDASVSVIILPWNVSGANRSLIISITLALLVNTMWPWWNGPRPPNWPSTGWTEPRTSPYWRCVKPQQGSARRYPAPACLLLWRRFLCRLQQHLTACCCFPETWGWKWGMAAQAGGNIWVLYL